MRTREEIEAAVDVWRAYRAGRAVPIGFSMEAVQVIADAYLAERAERQRRIEAAAEAVHALDVSSVKLIRDIITRHLDGETT